MNRFNFWHETSGPVEHWFKKHGGFPIPNIYASQLLQKDIELCDDQFHYI